MLRHMTFGLLLLVSLCLVSVGLLSANAVKNVELSAVQHHNLADYAFQVEDEEAEPSAIYNLTMSEYMFQVEGLEAGATLELEAGKLYELHFTNAGLLEHEFLIGQRAVVTDAEHNWHRDFEENLLDEVPVSIRGEMDSAPFVIGVSGLVEFELNPGQELTVAFTIPEEKVGEWQIACFVSVDPNAPEEAPTSTHFDLGMILPVVVSAEM